MNLATFENFLIPSPAFAAIKNDQMTIHCAAAIHISPGLAETFGSKPAIIDPTEMGNMYGESWKGRTPEFGFTPVRQLESHPLWPG
ncbi:MAG: hypothetical protein AAF629_14900 [Chloroflexota bacterium]